MPLSPAWIDTRDCPDPETLHKSRSLHGQQVPRGSTGCIAQERPVSPRHGPTAPNQLLLAMQEVSKPVTSTNTARRQLSFSIININQPSADRGSAEAGAPSRSPKDLQPPRNQSISVTNLGHDISAKAQGILLRISSSHVRPGSISLRHGADVM